MNGSQPSEGRSWSARSSPHSASTRRRAFLSIVDLSVTIFFSDPRLRHLKWPNLDDAVSNGAWRSGDKLDCRLGISGVDHHESGDWKI